ncbi:MAG: RNA methyltransferase [Planctomycetota bacterium]|nr:RNA methyltransferase [Planctomycetota bacterium]
MSTPPDKLLTSPQNPWVKELVKLRKDGNERRAAGRFFLEGRRGVEAALDQPHVVIHELIVSEKLFGAGHPLLLKARERGVKIVEVSKDVFKKLADVKTPQGIAAVVQAPAWDLAGILGAPGALAVAACGLQDPGNLGTLIRSCEAAGASGLLAVDATVDPYNAKVVRATAAGLLALPIVRLPRAQFLNEAAERGARLVGAVARGGIPYREFDWSRRPLVLCVGSEGEGLPPDLESACAERVTIPIRGKAESLNAAVAASILLFAAQA